MGECRIDVRLSTLKEVSTVRAETNDKSFDLYDEKTWNEAATIAIEGPREYACGVAAWAIEHWSAFDEGDYPHALTCRCEECR